MSELIDRQALKDYVSSLSTHPLNEWDTWGVIAAIDKQPTVAASPWHRVEDESPKPGCYLTASPFFHGDDYSWMYRLAWWTEHGLMDFVQDAEKESGWYIWNNSQDRNTEIEPMYWMHIEPPKEDA